MINLLVAESEPDSCKRIINNLTMFIKNIRISGIAYTVREAIEILRNQKINIVILDYATADTIKLLNYIDKNYLETKLKVILLAGKDEGLDEVSNECVFKIIRKPASISKIVNAIKELYSNCNVTKQAFIKGKIYKEMEKLQYNFSYIGTQYMAEAIYEIYAKNYIFKGGNLMRNVYPVIAENHNTTVNNVKCNITSATKCMTQRCPREALEDYLFCEQDETPKVKEIMYKIISKL